MPGGWELLLIIGVLVLLFGAKKLPDMARSIGQSARVFKGEMKGLREDEKDDSAKADTPAASTTPLPPSSAPSTAPKVTAETPEHQTRSQP